MIPVREGVRFPRLHVEHSAGGGGVRRMTELRHRSGLDLTDPLAREIEPPPDLFERLRLATLETESQRDDHSFPIVERVEQRGDLEWQEREHGRFERRRCGLISDEI